MTPEQAIKLGFKRVDSFRWCKDAGDGVVFHWLTFIPKRVELHFNGKYQNDIILE